MSIDIYNGYRAAAQVYPSIAALIAAVAPHANRVRDTLDATLYAAIVTGLLDDQQETAHPTTSGPVLAQARDAFLEEVNDGNPGEVWNDPHSLHIDHTPHPRDGYWYLLVHGVSDYSEALTALPGIEHHLYGTRSDRPDDLTDVQWTQRRNDWQFLISARRLRDVTLRWTHRTTADPNWDYLTSSSVIAHQPSIADRAYRLAQREANLAYLTNNPNPSSDELWVLMEAITGPEVRQRAKELQATLSPVAETQLATV